MTENKTKATQSSVSTFINSLPAHRRADAEALVKLMQSVSREKAQDLGFIHNRLRKLPLSIR
jgi:hypothetical protein